jgi:hypothetical protein
MLEIKLSRGDGWDPMLEIKLSRGEGWDPINRFNSSDLKPGLEFPTS